MNEQLQSVLRRAATSTFEELGFLFPEESPSEDQVAVPLAWSASVRFTGPLQGAIRLEVTGEVAAEVARNMLALDGDVEAELVADAVGELSNVICGNLVPGLGRPEDIFHLAPPAVTTEVAPGSDGGELEVTLGIEGGWARVRLHLHGAEAGALA